MFESKTSMGLTDTNNDNNAPKKSLKENTIATLTVVRKNDQGAFLDAGTGNTSDDILLHNAQQTEPIEIGDVVTVFLYHDTKHRLTASMHLPKLNIGQIAYTEVINATHFGCFVDVGTERGIFVPHAEMRGLPKEGEKVWIRLYEDKSGRLAASMDVDDAIRRASKPAVGVHVGDEVKGAIYNITNDGAFLITPERWIVFIHRNEMKALPRVGEKVSARVTFVRQDGRLNASLRPILKEAMSEDMEMIYAYLVSRQGRMPYTDKSDPELIKERFHISKAAFKRALGGLMKAGKITQEEGWTKIINNA